ncbi:probable histidine kinase 2 [Solanum lycopersicum]
MVCLAISLVTYLFLAIRCRNRDMSVSTGLANEAARQLNERTIHQLPELHAYHEEQNDEEALPHELQEVDDVYHPRQQDVSVDIVQLHPTEKLPLSGTKVLLIEDDTMSVTISQRVIISLGAMTYICRTARDSVNYVNKVLSSHRDVGPSTPSPPFDFILIDFERLKTGSFAAIVCIKRDLLHYGFRIPIMALTVHSNMEAIAKISNAEMDYYIPKPLKPDLILEAVDYLEFRKLFRRS